MKKLMIILVFFSFSYQVNSQTKIDVKTQFKSKNKAMQAVKIGIVEMINRVQWIKVGNIGEKYSLWIDNLNIIPDETDISTSIISLDLDLNTPAMFTHGKKLQHEHVTFKVNVNDTLPISNPPSMERALKAIDKNMNLSTSQLLTLGISTGGIGLLATQFCKVGSMFQKDFTSSEKTMGLWAGFYSLDAIAKMLKRQGEFKK